MMKQAPGGRAMAKRTQEIWDRLSRELFEDSWVESLGRYRSPYAFRGLASRAYELTPGLVRLGSHYAQVERQILANFKKYAHSAAAMGDSDWHWLALAQHHGLPTRLIDWTYSPYVALHFATADLGYRCEPCDGVVWAVDYVRSAQYLPGRFRGILE